MSKNPVLYVYKGVKIRKWNKVDLMIDDSSFKEIIDVVELTGFSIKKVLSLSGQPCERCKNIDVVAFDRKGDPRTIRRGILKSPHQDSGKNVITHAKSNSTSSEDLKIA